MPRESAISHSTFVRRLERQLDRGVATDDEFDGRTLSEEDIEEALEIGGADSGSDFIRRSRRSSDEERERLRVLLDGLPDGGKR